MADSDPDDGLGVLVFEWADAHANIISHRSDEIRRTSDALVCTELFRHDSHTQALLVLDTPAVIAVAPARSTFLSPDDVGGIRAFRLEPLQAIVLHQGTWHWGPQPLEAPAVHMFNVQGRGYREDNARVDLAVLGVEVLVLVGD